MEHDGQPGINCMIGTTGAVPEIANAAESADPAGENPWNRILRT